jgi:voltage-gated potassium channel
LTATESPLRRFRLALLLLLTAVVYGTAGYMLVERWNVFDSFYMTVITISTVGYEEVHPLDQAGRLFSTTLIVGGVGTMLYAFGLFAEALASGYFFAYRRQRRLDSRVKALKDHFIVCGYGRIGTQVVRDFGEGRTPYVVVETNLEALARLEREQRLYVEGDAADEEVLRAAGIERAKGLISAVDSDERAVYITLSARALNPRLYIMSRAGRPESVRRLELAGANRVVSPYLMAGRLMAQLALRPAVLNVIGLHHGASEIGVEEIVVPEGGALVGKELRETGLLDAGRARLLALRRSDGTLHVNLEDELAIRAGDLLVALGSEAQLTATAALVQ